MEWKADEEERTCSWFVKQRRDAVSNDGCIRRYFTCHRSGKYRSRGQSKRHLKVQGSNKIGRKCPAIMKTLISSEGQVQVTYRSDHQGHNCDFAHLPLPRKHRLRIAGMLAAGIPMNDVIDQLQAKEAKLTRLHFLTKSDMKNIMRDFNINKDVAVASQVTRHLDLGTCEDAPDHSTEETVSSTADSMQAQSETAAILGMSSRLQQHTSLSLAEEYWNSIKAELYTHPEIAPTVCNELRRVLALCSALNARPQMPTVSTEAEREPVNKLALRQQQFMSTKQKPKKRKLELTISKPIKLGKKFLLDSLDGT